MSDKPRDKLGFTDTGRWRYEQLKAQETTEASDHIKIINMQERIAALHTWLEEHETDINLLKTSIQKITEETEFPRMVGTLIKTILKIFAWKK